MRLWALLNLRSAKACYAQKLMSPLTSKAKSFAHSMTALWGQKGSVGSQFQLSVTAPFLKLCLSVLALKAGIEWGYITSPCPSRYSSLEHTKHSFRGLLSLTVFKVSKPPLTRRLLSNREPQRWGDILSFLQETDSHTDQGQIQVTVGTSN